MNLWSTLEEPWQVCLRLAWKSYVRGSLPIAAVIVDEQNNVVAQGRNRLRDDDAEPNALHNHPLAHAEVNALLDFPFAELQASRCTLLTTTEPCPLCVGAARMSHIGTLVYASRDAWAGCSHLFETDPYIRRKGTQVSSLAGSKLETVLIALQTDAHLRGARRAGEANTPAFFKVWREVVPVGVAAGEELFESGVLPELANASADVQEAVKVIEEAVQRC